MPARFVSEQIFPIAEDMDTRPMALGGPGLPRRFLWRGREVAVASVLEEWKETAPCSHGSAERYVRKHWFRLLTGDGAEMRIYYERQPRATRARKARWWLFTTQEAGAMGPAQP